MFRKKRQEKILREHEARQTRERFERNERAGKEIYARMAELKSVPRENLPDAVFMLSMAAKHQSEQIRQSIKDRTRYDFDFDTLTHGDLATYTSRRTRDMRSEITSPTRRHSSRPCLSNCLTCTSDLVSSLARIARADYS
jgi:hypothetical protein